MKWLPWENRKPKNTSKKHKDISWNPLERTPLRKTKNKKHRKNKEQQLPGVLEIGGPRQESQNIVLFSGCCLFFAFLHGVLSKESQNICFCDLCFLVSFTKKEFQNIALVSFSFVWFLGTDFWLQYRAYVPYIYVQIVTLLKLQMCACVFTVFWGDGSLLFRMYLYMISPLILNTGVLWGAEDDGADHINIYIYCRYRYIYISHIYIYPIVFVSLYPSNRDFGYVWDYFLYYETTGWVPSATRAPAPCPAGISEGGQLHGLSERVVTSGNYVPLNLTTEYECFFPCGPMDCRWQSNTI